MSCSLTRIFAENRAVPSGITIHRLIDVIRVIGHNYGSITAFKAYADSSLVNKTVRGQLSASAVSLVDCPHDARKDVADRVMLSEYDLLVIENLFNCHGMCIVDAIVYALENRNVDTTVILITNDRDFAHLVGTLKSRRVQVVVIAKNPVHQLLATQVTALYDWDRDVVERARTSENTLVDLLDLGKLPYSNSASLDCSINTGNVETLIGSFHFVSI